MDSYIALEENFEFDVDAGETAIEEENWRDILCKGVLFFLVSQEEELLYTYFANKIIITCNLPLNIMSQSYNISEVSLDILKLLQF